MINLLSLLLSSVLWVQVPQWSDDWSKCSVDVPDASCHWYITAPDNTFGEGFDWAGALAQSKPSPKCYQEQLCTNDMKNLEHRQHILTNHLTTEGPVPIAMMIVVKIAD